MSLSPCVADFPRTTRPFPTNIVTCPSTQPTTHASMPKNPRRQQKGKVKDKKYRERELLQRIANAQAELD